MRYYDNYLEHHGILGMKWGVRRFENANGHLTAAGKARYNTDSNGNYKKLDKTKRDSIKLDVKKAKTEYKQAKSNYKQSLKKASKNITDEDAREEFKNSSKEYKNAKKELQTQKQKLKDAKPPMSAQKKVAIALAASGAVAVGVLAIKHHNTVKAGADKVESVLKSGYTKAIEKSASMKIESQIKKQQFKVDMATAYQKGLTAPIAKRRQQHESEAKKLAEKYYNPRTNANDGVKSMVDRWLKGESIAGENGVNTYGIDYLENLLLRSGYQKKEA